jgi:hypothetical protein
MRSAKSNLSHRFHNLARKGLIARTKAPEGQAETIDLTAEERQKAAQLT